MVSAYGEESGLSIGNFYLDINLIASVAIFMIIFVAMAFATRKMKLFHTDGARIFVSLILAMFSVYGLSKTNVDYQTLFINWGIQNFLMSFSLILIILAIVTLWTIFNFRTVILVFSGAFLLMSFISYNWGATLIIGLVLGGIYFWLKKKAKKKTATDASP